ncbi:MAG: hypothetical protein ACHQET_03440 [Chitinophagales bacterium]
MKKSKRPLIAYFSILLFFLATTDLAMAANHPFSSRKEVRYAVLVHMSQNSKKHKIRLYTNTSQDKILCSISGIPGKKYQLFVFDVDSRLVSQAIIRNSEPTVLHNITKGNYLIEVLINDQHIESGQLTVR